MSLWSLTLGGDHQNRLPWIYTSREPEDRFSRAEGPQGSSAIKTKLGEC